MRAGRATLALGIVFVLGCGDAPQSAVPDEAGPAGAPAEGSGAPRADADAPSARGLPEGAIHVEPAVILDATGFEAPVAAAVFAHQVGDLVGPALDALLQPAARRHVEPGGGEPDLVDAGQAPGQVLGALVLEVDARPVGADQRVMEHVVGRPQLHVHDVERVADVDRVVEQDRRAVVARELGAQALQPERAGAIECRGGHRAAQRLVGAGGVQIRRLARILEDVGHGGAPLVGAPV